MIRSAPLLVLASSLLGSIACGGGEPEAGPGPGAESTSGGEETAGSATPPPATFADQVALGQRLYGEHCASCHGAGGEGTSDGPRVVGLDQGALPLDPPSGAHLRTGQFRTVADVAAFAVANMPPRRAGSLSETEYWAILAFDLKANGVDLPQVLDAALAPTLNLPGR